MVSLSTVLTELVFCLSPINPVSQGNGVGHFSCHILFVVLSGWFLSHLKRATPDLQLEDMVVALVEEKREFCSSVVSLIRLQDMPLKER